MVSNNFGSIAGFFETWNLSGSQRIKNIKAWSEIITFFEKNFF